MAAKENGIFILFSLIVGVILSLLLTVLYLEVTFAYQPDHFKAYLLNHEMALSSIAISGSPVADTINYLVLKAEFYIRMAIVVQTTVIIPLVTMMFALTFIQLHIRKSAMQYYQNKFRRYSDMFNHEKESKTDVLNQLDIAEAQLFRVHNQLLEGVVLIDRDEKILHLNSVAKEYFHQWLEDVRDADELFKRNERQEYKNQIISRFFVDYVTSGLSALIQETLLKNIVWEKEIYVETRKMWLSIRIFPTSDGAYIYFRDITEDKKPENFYKFSEIFLQKLALTAPLAVCVVDLQWNYMLMSYAWQKDFKLPEGDLVGKNHKQLMPRFPGKWQALEQQLIQGKIVRSDETMFHLNGQEEWVSWEIRPWKDAKGKISGFVLYAKIITDLKEDKERVSQQREREQQLAYHDVLTGLPNRQLFYDRLTMSLAQAYRQLDKVALFFLDLDGFKAINDNLGHDVGDMLLKEVAVRLQKCVRDSDTVARLGGDEFTVILTGISDAVDAEQVAKKVIRAIAAPYKLGGHTIHVSTSIGVSLYPLDGSSTNELIKKSDTAMYWAKEGGKNDYRFFNNPQEGDVDETEEEKEEIAEKQKGASGAEDMESQLQTALAKGELKVFFQPQYDFKTKRVYGLEALLRWDHPEYGLLRPARFLDIAERTGMILPIGEWVFKNACEHIQQWQMHNDTVENLYVSVNLSTKQLEDEELFDRIERIIKETNVPPNMLAVEVSEETVMEDAEQTRAILRKMKRLGVRIFVDDFGRAYTPMKKLRDFPIDAIKIYRSFVQNAVKNEEDLAIVKTMIALGKNLNIDVIAEGVETEEQADLLVENGCQYVQGFLFGKPTHPHDVKEYFEPLPRDKE